MPLIKYRNQITEAIDRFEDAFDESSLADIGDFLPDPSEPYYAAVLCELVRIDMDVRWERSIPLPLKTYLERFPRMLEDQPIFSQVCFEEYRQRRLAGDDVPSELYSSQFGIDVSQWSHVPTTHKAIADDSLFASSLTLDESNMAALRKAADEGRKQRRFGNFEMLAEIGRGAVAKVFLASQPDLANRFVVLKVARHFPTEPQTLSRLQHTNIMPIHSLHQDDDRFAICMPFLGTATLRDVTEAIRARETLPVSGRLITSVVDAAATRVTQIFQRSQVTLYEEVASPRPVPKLKDQLAKVGYERAALLLCSKISDGLMHAHGKGILHRDLKPANILLTDDGEPMLLDFNLADDGNEVAVRCENSLGGTLPYMAPEHLSAHWKMGGTVDHRSDIYALGVIIFKLFTGQLPFTAPADAFSMDTKRDLLAMRERIPNIRDFNPHVTPGSASIINRCLQPAPEDRYQDVAHLKQDIDLHLADLPLRNVREGWRSRLSKWTRRNSWSVSAVSVAILATALLLSPAVGAAYWLRQSAIHDAIALYQEFGDIERQAKIHLDHPRPTPQQLQDGLRQAKRALDLYQVLSNTDWLQSGDIHALPAPQREKLVPQVGHLLMLTALGLQLQAEQPANTKSESSVENREALIQNALALNRKAETCFRAETLPQSLYVQRAVLHEERGKYDEAKSLRALAKSMPATSATDHLLEARELFVKRHYADAMVHLEKAISQEPSRFSLWYLLGECHIYATRYAEAAECFSACQALAPEFVYTYIDRGVCHLRLRNLDLARRDFERVLELDANNVSASVRLVEVEMEQLRFESALEQIDAALIVHPNQPRLYFLRARIHLQQGSDQLAESDRQRALELTPTDAEGWMGRGLALMDTDPEEAMKMFDRASESLFAWNSARLAIAKILRRLGQESQAEQVLDEIIHLHPDFLDARVQRGLLYAAQGKVESAEREADVLLGKNDDARTKFQVAEIYAALSHQQKDKVKEALRLLREALANGYGHEQLNSVPELESLWDLPAFQKLCRTARMLQSE